MFKTGFGPTSWAVGMLEPVTMMRSVSATAPVELVGGSLPGCGAAPVAPGAFSGWAGLLTA